MTITMNKNFTKGVNRGFTQISNKLLACTEISIFEKMVIIILRRYLMYNSTCWPGVKTIASSARCSETTVKKAIKNLESKGYLKKTRQSNIRSNVYEIYINE